MDSLPGTELSHLMRTLTARWITLFVWNLPIKLPTSTISRNKFQKNQDVPLFTWSTVEATRKSWSALRMVFWLNLQLKPRNLMKKKRKMTVKKKSKRKFWTSLLKSWVDFTRRRYQESESLTALPSSSQSLRITPWQSGKPQTSSNYL